MKTPDGKTIAFTFGSHPMKDIRMRWKAVVTFPPGASETAMLAIAIVDGEDKPIERGEFEFAGKLIPIENGKGTLAYADFIAGKHESSLWLHREGIEPIPGGLTFG